MFTANRIVERLSVMCVLVKPASCCEVLKEIHSHTISHVEIGLSLINHLVDRARVFSVLTVWHLELGMTRPSGVESQFYVGALIKSRPVENSEGEIWVNRSGRFEDLDGIW